MSGGAAPFIEKHQARIFTAIVAVIAAAFAIGVWTWAKRPINYDALQSVAVSIGIAACGTASSVVVFWHLLAHEKEWWGNAKDVIAFIVMGAVLSLFASVIQVLKVFATL